MTTKPKLCVDCKHMFYAGVLPVYRGVQCAHRNNLGPINLVNGGQEYKAPPDQLRRDEEACGPYGVWFAPKTERIAAETQSRDDIKDDPPKRRHWWQTLIGG